MAQFELKCPTRDPRDAKIRMNGKDLDNVVSVDIHIDAFSMPTVTIGYEVESFECDGFFLDKMDMEPIGADLKQLIDAAEKSVCPQPDKPKSLWAALQRLKEVLKNG